MRNNTIVKIVALIVLTFCMFLNYKPQLNATHAITFDPAKGGRLGDMIYSYCLAKWLAYKYDLAFYPPRFKHAEKFSFDTVDMFLDQNIKDSFAKIIEITTEDELISCIKTEKAPTLFSVEIRTEIHFSHIIAECLLWPDIYSNIFHFTYEHQALGDALRRALNVKIPIKEYNPPTDRITVAAHIRKGSGGDSEMASVQYDDELTYIVTNQIRQPYMLVKSSDLGRPLKFPPEQFYVDQIIKLSDLFNNQPLFVCIFTDDKNPQQLLERIKKRITKPNISFDYSHNNSDNGLLQDIYDMSNFDCLIKPQSGLDLIVQLIGHHKIVVFPLCSMTDIAEKLNQVMIRITTVGICFNNANTHSITYSNFGSITNHHRGLAQQLFAHTPDK